MSQDLSFAAYCATSSAGTSFEAIFTAALNAYNKQTKNRIASHPLAVHLNSSDSPGGILALLRAQVQAFDNSQKTNEKLTKWLDPTVNVLYAFSAILGNGVGLVRCANLVRYIPPDLCDHRYSQRRMPFLLG